MADFTPIRADGIPLEGLAQRIWFAWHCLPRGKDGTPPSWRSLEMSHQLPNGVFSKILAGSRQTVEAATYQKLGRALRAPVLWLLTGDDPPDLKTTGPFQALGSDEQDPQEVSRRVRTYLRRCGFDETRIERAIGLLLAPDEAQAPPSASIAAAAHDFAKELHAPDDDAPPEAVAVEALRALSSGKGEEAHQQARRLARRVLSNGLPRDAVTVLADAPTWSAAALRLAEAALVEADRLPGKKRP